MCILNHGRIMGLLLSHIYLHGLYNISDTDETLGLVPVSVNFRVSVSVPVSV